MKSGVMTAVPRDWNPEAKMPTKSASAATIVRQLIKSSGGQLQESFLIVARETRRAGGGEGGQRFNREGMNPEWVAQRTEAQIAQLPPEEQGAAKAEFDAMRKVWAEVRALPEDQRREKMAEIFSRPEVQDRMAERAAAQDARRTPEQREKRMKNYVEHKKLMKAQNP
jgi:hypothetical protein